MTNLYSPVAIYAWENEKCKNIPCIENFDILFKLYNCHVEDLYILKQIDFSDLQVRENSPEYGTYRSLVNVAEKSRCFRYQSVKRKYGFIK